MWARKIRTVVRHQFEMLKPAMALIKTLYVDIMDARAELLTAAFIKIPTMIHDLHHNLCEGVEENEMRPEDSPLVRIFCTPNAKIAANYATFIAMLPALTTEMDLKSNLTFAGLTQDEITERVNKHVNTIQNFEIKTPKIVTKFLEQINK